MGHRRPGDPAIRAETAVHAGIEHQGQGPPISGQVGVGDVDRRDGSGEPGADAPADGSTGPPAPKPDVHSGSAPGSKHGPERGRKRPNQENLERLGPPVHPQAERLVEAGENGADETDDQFGVLRGAAEDEQLRGWARPGNGVARGRVPSAFPAPWAKANAARRSAAGPAPWR